MTRADRLTQNTQAAEALAQAHAATHAGQDRRRATVRRARNAVLYRGRIAFAHAHAAQLGRLDAAHARARKLMQALATRRRRAVTTRFSAGKRAASGPHATIRALSHASAARGARQAPGHRRIAHDEGRGGGGGSDQPPQQQHKGGGQQDERDERNARDERDAERHDGMPIRSGSGADLADWVVAALKIGNAATGTATGVVANGADAHHALERAYCARLLDLLEPRDSRAVPRQGARVDANGSAAPPDAGAPARSPAPASIGAPLLQLMLEARRAGAALGTLADPALATVLQTLIDVAGARDASPRTHERAATGSSSGPHEAHRHVNLLAGLILFSRHRPRPDRRGDNILLSLRDGASQRPRTTAAAR
ncbi:MAG: hypothetical protein ACRYGL_18395 [Janthinobacterium lividum]